MAATVNRGRGNEANYPDGQVLTVDEGHLIVWNGTQDRIAIFAPGNWIKAELDAPAA